MVSSPHLVGAAVRAFETGGLQTEGVLEGDEVDQAPFGLQDEVGPVAGGEQVPGPDTRLTPGGGMPACAVQGNGEMERGGHGNRF
jgi:hypothetical protein